MKHIFYISFFLMIFVYEGSYAQKNQGYVVSAMIIDGDTILMKNLPQVIIKDKRTFRNKKEMKRHDRLVRNVIKVYPYARLAGNLLNKYNDELVMAENNKERKRIMKKAEDELQEKYGDELKNLTTTQGIILIKLIDRETGHTSYELVKDLRGSFSAFIWQSLARIFSINLKSGYDSKGSDQEIEDIILLIDRGEV